MRRRCQESSQSRAPREEEEEPEPGGPALLTPAPLRAGPAVSSRPRAAARCGLPRCRHGLGLRLHSGEGEITLQAASGPPLLGSLPSLRRGRAFVAVSPARAPPTHVSAGRDGVGGEGGAEPTASAPRCPQPLNSSAFRAPAVVPGALMGSGVTEGGLRPAATLF